MPKERTFGAGNSEVSVSWQKDSPDVNVGLYYTDSQASDFVASIAEKVVSQAVSSKIISNQTESEVLFDTVIDAINSALGNFEGGAGLYTGLNQTQLNRYIKTLKTAGRGAFGNSEW